MVKNLPAELLKSPQLVQYRKPKRPPSIGKNRPVETSGLRHRHHHLGCRHLRVLEVESPFRHLRGLHQNRVRVVLYHRHRDLHEHAGQTTLVLPAARVQGAAQLGARADQVALVARRDRGVQVDQVDHRLVLMGQEAVQEAVQVDLEVVLSSGAAGNKNGVDVSKKNCSHKSWLRIHR